VPHRYLLRSADSKWAQANIPYRIFPSERSYSQGNYNG